MEYDAVMRFLETKVNDVKLETAQIGDIFIKQLQGNEATNLRIIRVIMPIGYGHMVRFDIVASFGIQSAVIRNTMFYQKGDKEAEQKALDGDYAT